MPKGDKLKLKADPEDGTTPIANLLLEAVAMAKISGLQKGAILYLWRVTYGWIDEDGKRKKECKVTLSEWANALDSTSARMSQALAELTTKNIIKRRIADIWGGYYYSLNTEVSKWNSNSINISKLCDRIGVPDFATITQNVTVTENATITQKTTVTQNDNSYPKRKETVTQNVTVQLPKTTQCTLYKENINKDKETTNHIFNYWNDKKIVIHIKLTDKIQGSINASLRDYTVADIKKAMDNYDEVIKNPTLYYFRYKWTLADFMKRGLEKFMDNATPLTNYLKEGNNPSIKIDNPYPYKVYQAPPTDEVKDEG